MITHLILATLVLTPQMYANYLYQSIKKELANWQALFRYYFEITGLSKRAD